jgi:hypothetical protein
MIAKGKWTGHYKYDRKSVEELRGIDQTGFEIEIVSTNNEFFTGTVRDDQKTGGTEGIGEINGKVTGSRIEFIKQMPVLTVLVQKGTRKTYNKKHPPIYYTGTLSDDRKTVSGQWRINFGFIWVGILPVPMMPMKGSWTMSLAE